MIATSYMGEALDQARLAQEGEDRRLAMREASQEAAARSPYSAFSQQLAFEQQREHHAATLAQQHLQLQRDTMLAHALQMAHQHEVAIGYLGAYKQMVEHQANAPTPAQERDIQTQIGLASRGAERGDYESPEDVAQRFPNLPATYHNLLAEASMSNRPALAAQYERTNRLAALANAYEDSIQGQPEKYRGMSDEDLRARAGAGFFRGADAEAAKALPFRQRQRLLYEQGAGRILDLAKQDKLPISYDVESGRWISNQAQPEWYRSPDQQEQFETLGRNVPPQGGGGPAESGVIVRPGGQSALPPRTGVNPPPTAAASPTTPAATRATVRMRDRVGNVWNIYSDDASQTQAKARGLVPDQVAPPAGTMTDIYGNLRPLPAGY